MIRIATIGGAAALLGAGVAIAVLTGAPAPAAPAGPGTASAGPVAERPSGVRGTRTANTSATAVPSRSAEASPQKTARAAGLCLFCDGRGRLVTIYKGTHFAIPNQAAFFVRRVSGDATFTARSAYDLNNVDQFDWNKLSGMTFTPLQPDRDASMVAWRYNLTSQMFEVAPFYDVNLARILPAPDEVITVPADQTFQFAVDYDGITVSYGDQSVFKPLPGGLTPNPWTAVRISGWFGGTSVAPRTVSYYIRLD